ncbi:uncharacterized protein NFIA_055140 [Aspergillus fischeri NRRL 181]|uniref:Uncharacterized protein n=1 Tax=Neosartorya fischeri (strain ATCC 1020 / DSM 3700 / CBS 544.65 / FGSC A1164 / JCM 1740 / NRRL 181 / WB 181) TaxID=331117 RepID=A1DMZ4_NEOFI|nr:uncharacterized protein NFIA_055140 [Aspergillus fischeri NRRL 181]EAW16165.1 hypothetical protein NFIA_055140 [Aspergillus fischeri NRRL 181]
MTLTKDDNPNTHAPSPRRDMTSSPASRMLPILRRSLDGRARSAIAPTPGYQSIESTERSSLQKDEDAFCRELRVFGGSWYNPEADGEDLLVGGRCHLLHHFEPAFSIVRKIAYPQEEDGGGVWVLGVGWPWA